MTSPNRDCDPVDPATFTPSNSAVNPGSGEIICSGDLQVAAGQYDVWGYVHVDLNAVSTANGAARAFLQYIQDDETSLLQEAGFILPCQMNWRRTVDGGPLGFGAAQC